MEQLLPVMMLKGLILLPNQEVKLELNNKISKTVVSLAIKDYNRKVIVITPKNQVEETPEVNDLPLIGVACKIKSRIELPNGNVRLTIKGIERVKILSFNNDEENEDVLNATVAKLELPKIDEVENGALIKKLKELTDQYVKNSKHITNSIINTIKTIDDLGRLTDMICSFMPMPFMKKLDYVLEYNPLYRAKNLLKYKSRIRSIKIR